MTDSGTLGHEIADRSVIDEALRRAAAAARREYVRAGLSMPVWRGGRLVWIEPTELKRYDADDHAGIRGHQGAKGIGAV
jgi:hypothetical protein